LFLYEFGFGELRPRPELCLATGPEAEDVPITAAVLALGWVLADPPLGDAARLPPLVDIRRAYEFNGRYRRHLEWRLEWEYHTPAGPDLRAALAEELRVLYDSLWGSHPEYKCENETKRGYLRKARLMLGREAYREMDIPPCVPLHRFSQLRW
jgi:hypothetical protein